MEQLGDMQLQLKVGMEVLVLDITKLMFRLMHLFTLEEKVKMAHYIIIKIKTLLEVTTAGYWWI